MILKFRTNKDKLSNDRAIELVALAQAGDLKSRNDLVECSLGLIFPRLRLHVYLKQFWQEAFQEAVFGLMKAIETFDVNKRCAFSTHATIWVDSYIRRFQQDNRTLIRTPHNTLEIQSRFHSIKSKFPDLDEEEAIELLARQMGKKLENIRRRVKSEVSTEYARLDIPEDDSKDDIYKKIAAGGGITLRQYIDLNFLLECLDNEERILIEMFAAGLSYMKISAKTKIDREHISKAVCGGIGRMRKISKEHL